MSQQSVLSDNSIIVAKARTVGVCFNAILEKQLIAKLLLFRGRHFRPVFVDRFCVVAECLASGTSRLRALIRVSFCSGFTVHFEK